MLGGERAALAAANDQDGPFGGAGGGKGERGGGSMRRSPGARRGVGLRLRSGVGPDDEEIVGRAAVSTGNWWCSNRIL